MYTKGSYKKKIRAEFATYTDEVGNSMITQLFLGVEVGTQDFPKDAHVYMFFDTREGIDEYDRIYNETVQKVAAEMLTQQPNDT